MKSYGLLNLVVMVLATAALIMSIAQAVGQCT